MAEPEVTVEETVEESPTKASFFSRLNVLLFLLACVGGECLIAYFYLPSASEAVAGVANVDGAADEEAEEAPYVPGELPPEDVKEVDLGAFNVTAYKPESNTSWRIDFHPFATMHKDDEQEFLTLYELNKIRIRDQVITILRTSEVSDFAEGNLGLIKRKISAKVNEILGKPYLREVFFSEFWFYEQ